VDHARRRDRELRHLAVRDARAQEREVIAEDRLRQPDAGLDVQRRWRELERSLGVAELHVQRVVDDLRDPVEPVDEVHVPGRAAQLAVGGRAQADVLLHAHDVTDGSVLGRAQLAVVDAPRRMVLTDAQQRGRPQEAADVVGAKRRCVAQRHQIG
jgi:hypothetical protein